MVPGPVAAGEQNNMAPLVALLKQPGGQAEVNDEVCLLPGSTTEANAGEKPSALLKIARSRETPRGGCVGDEQLAA